MSREHWKPVRGFEGLYMVSQLGGVYSTRNRRHLNPTKTGYATVTLCKNGKSTSRTVHRLVAEAFLPNPGNLPIVNHKDGNKQNNRLENLEWCTQKANVAHAIKMGVHGKIRRKRAQEKTQ
jgi:hypothetical protein